MSIAVEHLSKAYNGQAALKDVSFAIEKGEIVGFLGPNGAGKSTLMKILTTYLSADEGEAWVNGYNVKTEGKNVQQSIGYLPEHNPLYLEMYVKEYLYFVADLYSVSKDSVTGVIEQVGLGPEARKKLGSFLKDIGKGLGSPLHYSTIHRS